jgi:predicted amidophosphoribosyltransferase
MLTKLGAKPELLVPIPLHKSRLDSREFNQTSVIGNVLAKHCRVSISHSALSRTRNTQPQTSMCSDAARKANLLKASRECCVTRKQNARKVVPKTGT